jgi:DNA-binding transcriptional ArsR family regulator
MNLRVTKLLGLSREEVLIIKALKGKSLNISQLSSSTKVPRTTLYTAISSLKERDLIRSEVHGKSNILSIQNIQHLEQIGEVLDNQTNEKPFEFIYGKELMLKEYELIYGQKNKRIFAIQPTASLLDLLHKFHANVFIPINENMKKNKLIVEGIIKEDAFTVYLNEYKNDKGMQQNILKSFHGRMNSSTFISKKYLNCNSELTFDDTKAYLFNWKDEVGIKILDKNTLNFLREMFEFTKGYGKKDDLNRVVAERIEILMRN